jgi:hypothetical protein
MGMEALAAKEVRAARAVVAAAAAPTVTEGADVAEVLTGCLAKKALQVLPVRMG